MSSDSAAESAYLIAAIDPIEWSLPIALVMGGAMGFLVVWAFTRHTRRVADEQAAGMLNPSQPQPMKIQFPIRRGFLRAACLSMSPPPKPPLPAETHKLRLSFPGFPVFREPPLR